MSSCAIYAIRVQDVRRGIWYNYDNGVWDREPCVSSGVNNLYVAFVVYNPGDLAHVRLMLVNGHDGTVIKQQDATVYHNGAAGLEWTGTMPSTSFLLTCYVYP